MPTLQFNITKDQQQKMNEIKKETGVVLKKQGQQAIAEYIKKHGGKK